MTCSDTNWSFQLTKESWQSTKKGLSSVTNCRSLCYWFVSFCWENTSIFRKHHMLVSKRCFQTLCSCCFLKTELFCQQKPQQKQPETFPQRTTIRKYSSFSTHSSTPCCNRQSLYIVKLITRTSGIQTLIRIISSKTDRVLILLLLAVESPFKEARRKWKERNQINPNQQTTT